MAVNQKKKSDKKEANLPSNKKQFILLGVVVVLFAFAGVMLFSGGGSSDDGGPAQAPVLPSGPQAGFGPGGMGPGMLPPPPGAMGPMEQVSPEPAKPIAGLEKPKADVTGTRLMAAIDEYFKRYEAAVKDGGWKKLSVWAYSQGLYVEARYSDVMDDGVSRRGPKLQESVLTITDPTTNVTKLLSQQEYEETLAQKLGPKMFSYKKTAERIKDLPSGGGSSNLSRLASLLVTTDTLRGRELYRESIKDKKFYSILMRAVGQAYLGQELENQAWEGSWLEPVPMNLWLVEQLVDLDPAVFEKTEKTKDDSQGQAGGPMGPGGPPGMPPGMMGPGMGPMVQEVLAGLDHRKMVLSILSRRGGMVSSHLIGKLIAKDTNNTLLKGIMQGQVDSRLLRRFTDIYAEPLVEPLTTALKTVDVSSPGWTVAVETLAGLNNDRISYLVFNSAAERGVLSSKAVLLLSAGASGYTLGEVAKFVENGKVQDVPVESIFGLWTTISPQSKQSLWGLVSGFIPNVQGGDSQSMPMGGPPMPETDRRIRGVRMPDGVMPPPPDMMMPPPGDPRMMGPGGPPPGMMVPPGYSMNMPGGAAGSQAMRTHGWPVERNFVASVNTESAKKFLVALGQLKVDVAKVTPSEMGPGGPMMPPPMGMMGMGPMTSSIDETGKARVRQTAIRCLVVLDDVKLAEFFRKLINDPQVGDFSRLGLCVLDDRESIKPLLNRFWKHPLEINTVLMPTGGTSDPEQDKVMAGPEKVSVPLDTMGLPRAGCSARDAMIYFDHREAGQAFLSALGEMITHKDAFDNPREVADAACALISGLGRWSVPQTASTLADLIESTSDFGLRGGDPSGMGTPDQNQLPMQVRLQALSVLGAIGDPESMNVILRIATYSRRGELLGMAAQIALAKRGTADAGDLFLDMLDPGKADKNAVNNGNIESQIAKIDPLFKTLEDIALLGLSKIELNDIQIPRAIKLIRTLGEKQNSGYNGADLQEQLVLSLLRARQGAILNAVAEMIGNAPMKPGSEDKEPFYWNRTSGQSQDQLFMKMISAMSQGMNEKDEAGVAAVVTAVVRREEKSLMPTQDMQFEPKQHLVQFENGNSFGGGMMMPMGMPMMPPMPGMVQAGAVSDTSTPASPKYEPGFNFPSMDSSQGLMEQTAAVAGIRLMGKLKDAQRYLKPLMELSYYRYMAGFMLWQIGSDADGEQLTQLLANSTESSKEMYLKFLAIDQLQRTDQAKLRAIFARALSRTTDRATQAKLGDGALYLSMQTWKNQMMGRTSILRDSQQVDAQVEAWRAKMESRGYDRMLTDRMVIVLSTLQENDQSLKWMTDMVRQQGTRSDPISETAVGESVRILRSLNPAGKESMLEYYLTVLNQTVDPEKARQAAEKAQSIQMMPQGRMPGMGPGMDVPMGPGPGGMGGPGGRVSRTRVRPAPRTPVKRVMPVPVYRSIGPMVVEAVGQMNQEEVLSTLMALARTRSDLVGSIAVEVYPRDNRQGQKLFRQMVNDSSKGPELNDQVRLGLRYLLEKSDPLAFELLVRSAIKSDSSVSVESLNYLIALDKEGQLPESLDMKSAMKTIIQGLMVEKRIGREVSQTIAKVAELNDKELNDREIGKMIDRLNLIQAGPRVR